MPIDPTARQILTILAELDEDTLRACYGIRRAEPATSMFAEPDPPESAPLDAAIYAWIDAGRPIDGGAEPSATPSRYSAEGFVDVPPYAPDPLVGSVTADSVTVVNGDIGTINL